MRSHVLLGLISLLVVLPTQVRAQMREDRGGWADGWRAEYERRIAHRYWEEHRGHGFYGYPFYANGYPYGMMPSPADGYAAMPYTYPSAYYPLSAMNPDEQNATPPATSLGTVPELPKPSSGTPPHQPSAAQELLTASGVPLEESHIRWPTGLRVLAATETNELRQRIEESFQLIAQDKATKKSVDADVWQDLRHDLDRLERLVQRDEAERWSQSLTTYQEAEQFVYKLRHALARLQHL